MKENNIKKSIKRQIFEFASKNVKFTFLINFLLKTFLFYKKRFQKSFLYKFSLSRISKVNSLNELKNEL